MSDMTQRLLPPGWRWMRLDQALEMADLGIWGEPDADSGMSILRSTNFRNDGTFDLSDLALRAIPAEKHDQKVLLPGDIVLERSGGGPKQPVGRVCFFEGDKRDHTFGNFCQRLRARSGMCDARFLFWHLYLFHMSGQTQLYQTRTTGIRNLEYKRYLAHELPLPPLPEQQRIVAILSEQIAAVERARAATESQLEAARALPAAYLRAVFDSPEAQAWPRKRLGDVCEINPARPNLNRAGNVLTSFVPMAAVKECGRGIARIEQRPFHEIRKGYTYFAEGDVLFAKITPCMQNGKHAIARGLIDGLGFGSTEFHVLRPTEGVISEWVHKFVLQPWVLRDATAHFTGAVGQQRVPENFLAALYVPLPPFPEQRRIVAILSEQMATVEKARQALEVQLDTINKLPAALLRRAFNGEI